MEGPLGGTLRTAHKELYLLVNLTSPLFNCKNVSKMQRASAQCLRTCISLPKRGEKKSILPKQSLKVHVIYIYF